MLKALSLLGTSSWTPPLEEPHAYPDLPFLPSMFKRRLGQLDRMALLVGHEALQGREASRTRLLLASARGELFQQYSIGLALAESAEMSPAAFSLSVFNAPISLLSIAEHCRGGATAIHAAQHSLAAGLCTAWALLARSADPVLLIAADENCPDFYDELKDGMQPAAALALLLARDASEAESPADGESRPDTQARPPRLGLAFNGNTEAVSGSGSEAAIFAAWLGGAGSTLSLGGDTWPVQITRL